MGDFLTAAAALKTPTRNCYNAQGVNLNLSAVCLQVRAGVEALVRTCGISTDRIFEVTSYIFVHMFIYIVYIYIYVYICVCVCVFIYIYIGAHVWHLNQSDLRGV